MNNTTWKTPPELFDLINQAVGGFAVDAAADQYNHLLPRWLGPGSEIEEDALNPHLEWLSPAWCNPPYGKGIEKWLEKFAQQGEAGVGIVALIPASIETSWWSKWIVSGLRKGALDVIFLTGRVNFLKPCSHCDRTGKCEDDSCCVAGDCDVCDRTSYVEGGAPRFPSALIFYGPTAAGQVAWLDWKKRLSHAKEEQVVGDQDLNSGSLSD